MIIRNILRAVPGVVSVFLCGLLLGARMGIDGPIGSIVGVCALVMIVAAALLFVVERQQKKKEQVATTV